MLFMILLPKLFSLIIIVLMRREPRCVYVDWSDWNSAVDYVKSRGLLFITMLIFGICGELLAIFLFCHVRWQGLIISFVVKIERDICVYYCDMMQCSQVAAWLIDW